MTAKSGLGSRLRVAFTRILPDRIRRRPSYQRLRGRLPVGRVNFGDLGGLEPVSRSFGFDRGLPIDRHYIEDFLRTDANSSRIRGRILEVGEPRYAPRFGDQGLIEQVDVIDISASNPQATVIADLTDAPELPSNTYDCIICTQTLFVIYDLRSAVDTLHRILRPAGTVLATVPGISQIAHSEAEDVRDQWRFTTNSARRLFEEFFDPSQVTIETYGNVLTAAAFLYGLAVRDLKPSQLDVRDPDFQVVIAIKAEKNPANRSFDNQREDPAR